MPTERISLSQAPVPKSECRLAPLTKVCVMNYPTGSAYDFHTPGKC